MKLADRKLAFTLSMWGFALLTIGQLWIAGLALASRYESSRTAASSPREKPQTIIVRVPAPAAEQQNVSEHATVSRPPLAAIPLEAQAPAATPRPISPPPVNDPRAEKLIKEAQTARVAGDMQKAIVKLEEALAETPEDPTAHYEMALVHEQMEVYDRAAAHYEKVFQMGVSRAGSFYQLAANKLRDGFIKTDEMSGQLALSRIRIYHNPKDPLGEHVILTVPVQKSPTAEIDLKELAISVTFFNRNERGEIEILEDSSRVKEQWVSEPFDWAGGEETLRMSYHVPIRDAANAELFGKLSYHGQVVSLLYQGEVIDMQAWPRELAARIPQAATEGLNQGLLPEFQESLPLDFDPEIPLLPARE